MHKPANSCRIFLAVFYCFAAMSPVAMFATQAVAAKRWSTPKKSTIRVRLLMELPGTVMTTAARNQETFVAEQELPYGTQLVKLSYEYLYYQPPLTQTPSDNGLTYKLRVSRDKACDESLSAIGQELGLNQESVVQALGLKGSEAILECYRTTPQDYISARRTKAE